MTQLDRSFAIAATLTVILGIISGFRILGTPQRQRQIAADRERISDLVNIARQLHQKASNAQTFDQPFELPETLDQASNLVAQTTDPITNEPYVYRQLSDTTYELCASFATDTSTYSLQPGADSANLRWQHPAGQHCFEFDVLEPPQYP